MLICPTCQHTLLPGEIYCSECGNSVPTAVGVPLSQDRTPIDRQVAGQKGTPRSPARSPEAGIGLALRLIDTGDIIRLNGSQQVTLGRFSSGQPVAPDVDLGPFKGYEAGVSRLHAAIQTQDGQVFVQDLGSANGTRLNGKRIEARHLYRVMPGDVLTMGKLKVQIIIPHPRGG